MKLIVIVLLTSLSQAVLALEEPTPEKRPHELTIHGDTRIDEYYWLRDDERNDPEVLAYLEQENAYAERALANQRGLTDVLFEELKARIVPNESGLPWQKGGFWYYYHFEAGDEYPVYARRKGSMEGEEEILIDARQRALGSEFYALRNWEVSDDHRYVAIAEDTLGRRIHEIRILDTRKGEFLPEVIGNAWDSLAFSADGEYLYYLILEPQTLLMYRVMRHRLGTDPSEDVLVYEETSPSFYTSLGRSRSGKYIIIHNTETDTHQAWLIPADEPLSEPVAFLPREAGHVYDVEHANNRFYVRSNWQAENFRVMEVNESEHDNKEAWREVIAHRGDARINSFQVFDRWLVVDEYQDGLRKVRVRSHDGTVDRYMEAPEKVFGMSMGYNPTVDTDRIRYRYSSLVTPQQDWEVDMVSGESTLLRAREVPGYESSLYRTSRRMVTARDGTKIPVSLAHHKDTALDGKAPALIYAYGAYGSTYDPVFDRSMVSLLDRGFVYAYAHIRGGEEFGQRWYDGGRLLNKKNTFTDFIDVTRGLQEEGVIDPDRTFAQGGSAGGLLMGAVLNMAPDLYKGVIAEVAFVDVVTTMADESIPLTANEWNEWGNPKIKEQYEYMLSYSPYDQVSAQDYPNMFITAGLHDPYVQYFEPAKWVARLRDRRTDDNLLVFLTDMDSGHGGQWGRYKQYRLIAQQWAFLVYLAGFED